MQASVQRIMLGGGVVASNPFMIDLLGGFNPVQKVESQIDQNQQKAEAENKRAAFAGAIDGSPESMENLARVDPKLFTWMDQRNAKRAQVEGAERAAIKKGKEQEWLIRYDQALTTNNQELQQSLIQEARDDDDNDLEHGAIGKNAQTDKAITKAALYNSMGKDQYSQFYGGGSDKELPAEAVAFNDLIKDMTPKQQKLAKLIKTGQKGRAVSNAIMTGVKDGTIDSYSKANAKIRQEGKFAEMTGASRAKTIDQGIEKIAKIDVGLANIGNAIEAVRSGAGTGAIEKKFPSLREASIALDNIQGRMALDVIGAVTFGALSQGELDLAREVALPTGLEGPALINHLEDRAVAQQKLRDYYNDQIQFLDQGGTVAGFLREKERGAASQPQEQAPQGQPQQKEGGQIMTDANGNRAMVYPDGTFEEL